MRSIQAQLLAWLLPGFVAVSLTAGGGVYVSARRGYEADLDARLGELTGMARSALRVEMAGERETPRGPTLPMFLARDEFQVPGQYFQQWALDGATVRKSMNLATTDLPRPPELSREPVKYDSDLPGVDRVRVRAVRLTQVGAAKPVDFAVAVSRNDVDRQLSRLAIELVLGGAACCAVLALLLCIALRLAMRPLTRLGQQASTMDAGSLGERFPLAGMPGEIVPIITRLNELIARLQQSFERERRFSGDLAHELRTPLAAIRSTSEVAAKWPEQASPDDFQEIAQIAAQLQQTVDGLLSLARAETAEAELLREPVDFAPLIDECITQYSDAAARRDVAIDVRHGAVAIPPTDPRLLRIIVSNLVANAVEYAPQGSRIVIESGLPDRLLEVSNAAPLLVAADLPHIFQRLWRKDASRTGGAHAGLGLSLAKSCCDALGWKLVAALDAEGRLSISLRT